MAPASDPVTVYCTNRPAMTYEQAQERIESYGEHRIRLEAYRCTFCQKWHLRAKPPGDL